MRPLRLSLLAISLFLTLVVAGAIYVGSSNERSFALIKTLVARSTPYRLELTSPQLTWSPFAFSADLILLRYTDPDSPPLASAQRLSYEAPLGQLLRGELSTGLLTASNISYFLDDEETDEPIDLESLLLPLSLMPAEVRIDSVHFMSQREQLWIFPLLSVDAKRGASGTMQASATAYFADQPAGLKAQLDWSALGGQGHRLDLTAALIGREQSSRLNLQGFAETYGPDLSYQLALDGQYERVSDFITAFDASAYPFSGELKINGQLKGNLTRFELQISELTLTTPEAYTFTASGTVTQHGGSHPQLALEATGEADKLENLLPLPDALIASLERSELRLKVAGTLDRPELLEAGVRLYAAGNTQIELYSADTELSLAALETMTLEEDAEIAYRVSSQDLLQLLKSLDIQSDRDDKLSLEAKGTLRGTGEELVLTLVEAGLEHADYSAAASGELLWRDALLSAPEIVLSLQEKNASGKITAEGTIADILTLRGVALRTLVQNFDVAHAAELAQGSPLPIDVQAMSGSMLLLRASEPLQFRELALKISPLPGIELDLTGGGELLGDAAMADLQWTMTEFNAEAWSSHSSLPIALSKLNGQVRLRPRYATLLLNTSVGSTEIQAVLNADINSNSLGALNLDLYSPHVYLQDFPLNASSKKATDDPNETGLNTAGYTTTSQDWRRELPGFPMHATLRADLISGATSQIEHMSVAIESEQQRLLLTHFDANYAGGALILRGAADLAASPPAFSLAGQGIHVPLAALTQDLGLQQAVRGGLSFRGGVATQGVGFDEALGNLSGRIALATDSVTVSGAAYDLLMSNLLAWLVKGASEKTTTFDCAMVQFDIGQGFARSDSLFIETKRMLATGKASIDLQASTLDLRLEPRSKTRTFQFPSAVRMRGPLSAPSISVSPLQTTADLSAQALLLLPSLTLRMFGIGPDDAKERPCDPSLNPA